METHENQLASSVGERGTTLTEVVIASVMLAAVLSLVYGGVVSVGSMTQENNRVSREQSRERDLLHTIRSELELSGKDPGRIIISADGKSVRYRKLTGAARNGAEVSGVWSSTIELALDDNGNVVRRENGRSALLAISVSDLTFERTLGADFVLVTIVTEQARQTVSRSIRVYPKN